MWITLSVLFVLLSLTNYLMGQYAVGVCAAVISLVCLIGFVKEW